MCKHDGITLCSPTGQLTTIDPYRGKQQVQDMMTVKQLKQEAVKKFPRFAAVVIPDSVDNVQLIWNGKPLDDDSASLSKYGVKPQSVVQMVTKVNGG